MSKCPHCEKPILITEFLDKTVEFVIDDDVVDVHKWCVDEFISVSNLIQCEVCCEYSKNNKGFVFCQRPSLPGWSGVQRPPDLCDRICQAEDTNISGWRHLECCPELRCEWCGHVVVKQKDRIKIEVENRRKPGEMRMALFHKRCVSGTYGLSA